MGFSLILEGLLKAHLLKPLRASSSQNSATRLDSSSSCWGDSNYSPRIPSLQILPLLHNRDGSTVIRVLRLWVVVLAANICATWIIAAVLAYTPIFAPEMKDVFAGIATPSMSGTFGATILKGHICGLAHCTHGLAATQRGEYAASSHSARHVSR